MGLELDERQRAMLQEMGVPVWLPVPAPAVVLPPAAEALAARAATPPVQAVQAAPAMARVPASAPVAAPAPARAPAVAVATGTPAASSGVGAGIAVGAWQLLYPVDEAHAAAPGWLVLAESTGDDLFAGDAGKLLDNMLRAAGLHRTARVWGAAVGRAAPGTGLPLAEGLQAGVAEHRPALVLAMGRLAAQAATGSSEPLGRLRGQVHHVGGVPLVATYDAPYLLRAQADKARAWEDLCRALEAAGKVA